MIDSKNITACNDSGISSSKTLENPGPIWLKDSAFLRFICPAFREKNPGTLLLDVAQTSLDRGVPVEDFCLHHSTSAWEKVKKSGGRLEEMDSANKNGWGGDCWSLRIFVAKQVVNRSSHLKWYGLNRNHYPQNGFQWLSAPGSPGQIAKAFVSFWDGCQRPGPKRKLIFQRQCFRCDLLVSGRVTSILCVNLGPGNKSIKRTVQYHSTRLY